ncbi:phage NrS-1 polymerase family protein [Paracoccus albicereus]|nr:DUF5906 domain-containing protein [Paracoccus albicereus]
MQPYRQFVVWRLEYRNGNPKATKVPYDPKTGIRASSTDPTTWGYLSDAQQRMEQGGYTGIGFVFAEDDPFCFLDFDDCIDDTGNWIDGTSLWKLFEGSAWEISQSGNGFHVIVTTRDKAALSRHVNKWRRPDGGMNECYGSGRFVAFGPHGWQGEPQPADTMLQCFVPLRSRGGADPLEWRDRAIDGYDGPSDDDTLLRRMLNSRGGAATIFKTAAPFRALWEGDTVELSKFHPDASGKGKPFDHSSADMALMNHLAWWTGCDHARMWRLFKRSSLYRPEKERTALRALDKAASEKAARGSYLKSREQRMKEAGAIGEGERLELITPKMTLDEMSEKLVFIRHGNGVADRTRRTAQKMESARTDYSASKHEIETGKIDKETGLPVLKTVSTFETWRQSEKLTVDQLTWQPGEDQFCKPLEEHGIAFNTYRPLLLGAAPKNWKEWINPFVSLVEFLVPMEAERNRFYQWLAHIIQRPFELPHTCYLFFTPAHGTGRGTLAEMLARVFKGYAAIGVAPDMAITDGFNGRLSRKLIATVDEVREGARNPHSKEAQAFKSRVNESNRHINPKFGIQSVEKNCMRWLFFSQHEDALPFDNHDRRVIVIANPTKANSPEWYSWLHQYLEGGAIEQAFVASVQQYLASFDLTGFNPGAHAPMNEAKRRAIAAMESEALRAARQFAATWGEGLATTADLRAFVGDDDWPSHSRGASDLIKAAGMMAGKKVTIDRKAEKLLIVNPNGFPPDFVQGWPVHEIAAIIRRGRQSFGNS